MDKLINTRDKLLRDLAKAESRWHCTHSKGLERYIMVLDKQLERVNDLIGKKKEKNNGQDCIDSEH